MEQNNFEKNIQQKMDELKIPPSDSVWTNIEKRIDKKQKDRRVIFILFFLILFLLSGGYWLLNSGKNSQGNQSVSNLGKRDSKPRLNESFGQATNNQDSSFNKSVTPSSDSSGNYDIANISPKRSKTPAKLQSTIFQDESENNIKNKRQQNLTEKAYSKHPPERIIRAGTNNEENEIGLNNANNFSAKKPGNFEIERKKNNSDLINNIQNKITGDSLSDQLKSEKITKGIIAKNNSSTKRNPEKRQKNHWIFGITLSAGKSMIGEDPLGINNSNADYLQSSPLNAGSYGGTSAVFNPSKINNSFAFIIGAFVGKNISKKSKILLGISYKYFSLVNKVGAPTSSALYQFSAANNINSYRNNFHYLELPVSFKFQLNKSKMLPLYWQAGINISQLISSNALQFQASPGLYYNNNSLFKKTQLGLNTGISATLFSKQRIPLTIGPYFYYDASKLANKGLYQNKHFSFIGIRTEILFHKK